MVYEIFSFLYFKDKEGPSISLPSGSAEQLRT